MTGMEAAAARDTPYLGDGAGARGHQPAAEHAAGDLLTKRIIVGYGFWVFLLSDIIMFSAFFATYAVLVDNTAGGPSGHDLFDLRNTGIETACLLLSSFTCGLASIGAQAHRASWFYGATTITFIFGAAFVVLEFARVRRVCRARREPDAQRIPVGVLYVGWLPRHARDGRPGVDVHDDGTGVRQGVPA